MQVSSSCNTMFEPVSDEADMLRFDLVWNCLLHGRARYRLQRYVCKV